MQTNEVVKYDSGESHYELEIARSNGYIAAKRAMLAGKALVQNEKETDEVLSFARFAMYPDFIAPVVSHKGFDHWPITLDELLALDEELIVSWSAAIYKANPHWQNERTLEREAEKKEMPLSVEPGGI